MEGKGKIIDSDNNSPIRILSQHRQGNQLVKWEKKSLKDITVTDIRLNSVGRPSQNEIEISDEKPDLIKSWKSLLVSFSCIKYVYSMVLTIFCIVLVMACIFTRSTTAAESPYNIHPVCTFFIFWFLISWLAIIEGGQAAFVGLQAIEKDLYRYSHKITILNTNIVHKGDNLERFIIGRQFLNVLIIFLINMCGKSLDNADPLHLPKEFNLIFLNNGLAMMVVTIILGQIPSQVNAAVSMIDFINNYFITFTSYVSLLIEFSGLLHSVYLFQIFFSKVCGKPIVSNEPVRSTTQKLFFWGRILISLVILSTSLAITLYVLFKGSSGMWDGVPSIVSLFVFFLLLCVLGMLEGMQIAAFALVNMKDKELSEGSFAYTNCNLIFAGKNLQAFLIGRQAFVASIIFIIARIVTVDSGGLDTIFGVNNNFHFLFDSGFLGVLILTIIGSLAWRVIASSFPLAFMSNPFIYIIIYFCLFLEKTGICYASWVIASLHKKIMNYQPDYMYIEKTPRIKKFSTLG